MNTQHVELASFVTDDVDIAKPLLSQVGMIAIIIYTSQAKLAQFYTKFGEAAHATLASPPPPNAQHLTPRRPQGHPQPPT